MSDLSKFDRPVSESFFCENIRAEDSLAQEQISDFLTKGFVTGIRVLTGDQVNILRQELHALMLAKMADDLRFYEFHLNESTDPGRVLFHALGAWRVSPAFHDVIFLPSVVKAAEQLLDGPVRFWHDQIFVKPPRDGAVVEWHQDYSYWTRTKPMAHLTCWIGLDDSTEENGCVHYVPGSHRWPLLPRYELSGNMESVFQFLNLEQSAEFLPVPATLLAGEASFHHPLTLHGSFENSSDRPRRAVVLNFIRDGVVSDSDEPLLFGIPPVPRGEKLCGRFFPLLDSSAIYQSPAFSYPF